MTALYVFDKVSYEAPAKSKREGALTILSDVSFKVERGSFLVITGPSGGGKTTLLRLFNRLIDPTSGNIYFDGRNIKEHPILQLRSRIGWVPQVPVRFPGTVESNIRLPFALSKLRKYSPNEISEAVERVKSMGILPEELFKRRAEDLSVGEAQRMNLLRALVLKPEVLLLDEPTSALDREAAEGLLEQILRIREEERITVIMVSHHPEEAKKVGSEILRIDHGRVEQNS